MRKVLIVEAEEEYRRPLLAALEGQYEVYYAEDATEASLFLSSMAFDAMVLDLCLSGLDGLSLLRLHIQHLPPCVLVITGFSSGYVRPSTVICRSSIASSSADCVLLEVRLISSPRSRLARVAAPS